MQGLTAERGDAIAEAPLWCNKMGDVSATQQNLPSGLTVLGMDESAGHDDILESDRY